jgi:hypothetical protein
MKLKLHVVQTATFVLMLFSTLFLGAAPYQAEKSTSSPAPVEHTRGTRLHAKGIPNFAEVTPNLFRGAQPSLQGLEALKNLSARRRPHWNGGRIVPHGGGRLVG